MRRRPNPWIVLPAVVSAVIAAWLGGTVTAVSCRYQQADGTIVTCPGWTATVAVLSFLVIGLGVAVVLVLVYRSLAEWQEQKEARTPSGTGEDQ